MASFHIENSLHRFFDRTQFNRISAIMIHQGHYISESCGDYLKREPGDIDTVSYIPRTKIKYIDDNLDVFDSKQKNRITIKVGRIPGKFFNPAIAKDLQIKDSEVEEFVNLFKSYYCADETKLKIVEGDEILPYYDMENYATVNGNTCGPLWNSCMRYKEKNKFMTLYAKNPDSVKMLVYFDDSNKVRARALLWMDARDKHGNSYKVMDRIYSLYDHDVIFFKDWAKNNGYISKMEQSAHSERYYTSLEGKSLNTILYVQLKNYQLQYYPYFDTFKFYDPTTGKFWNSENSDYQHVLVQNWGGLEPEPREQRPDAVEEPLNDEGDYVDGQDDFGRDFYEYRPSTRRRGARTPRVVSIDQGNVIPIVDNSGTLPRNPITRATGLTNSIVNEWFSLGNRFSNIVYQDPVTPPAGSGLTNEPVLTATQSMARSIRERMRQRNVERTNRENREVEIRIDPFDIVDDTYQTYYRRYEPLPEEVTPPVEETPTESTPTPIRSEVRDLIERFGLSLPENIIQELERDPTPAAPGTQPVQIYPWDEVS